MGGAISFYSPSLTDTEVALTEAKRRKRSCGIDDDQIQVGLLGWRLMNVDRHADHVVRLSFPCSVMKSLLSLLSSARRDPQERKPEGISQKIGLF